MAQESIKDEYSSETTLITFPKPIPLLRGPIPANPKTDPKIGPYILAFPNPNSFLKSLSTCQSKLIEECESGSRVGCSISASNKCTPPWWKSGLMGKRVDFKERAECEEREMNGCLVGSTEKCVKFAQEKCLGPFLWARVRKGKSSGLGLFGLLGLGFDDGDGDEVGYVRGSVILGTREE